MIISQIQLLTEFNSWVLREIHYIRSIEVCNNTHELKNLILTLIMFIVNLIIYIENSSNNKLNKKIILICESIVFSICYILSVIVIELYGNERFLLNNLCFGIIAYKFINSIKISDILFKFIFTVCISCILVYLFYYFKIFEAIFYYLYEENLIFWLKSEIIFFIKSNAIIFIIIFVLNLLYILYKNKKISKEL